MSHYETRHCGDTPSATEDQCPADNGPLCSPSPEATASGRAAVCLGQAAQNGGSVGGEECRAVLGATYAVSVPTSPSNGMNTLCKA
ncbi:hypothetical protein H920_15336 [Fukomys damarensis]|uniref:Uncharacterized protein n=1 Tax=Fukomys damarensis TaxID=885580 RepID=A0A091DK70_FUKDA|nr:hypothetical protein H920_15336 [Fukomys damarensis]